jgi:hypothetical protein
MEDPEENSNRRRVSARFILAYFFIIAIVFMDILSFDDSRRFHRINSGTISSLVLAIVLGAVVWYFFMTMKIIEYDDVKCILYVMDWKRKTEIQIPVEKIDKILFSMWGERNSSYVIVYRGKENLQQRVRLFPIPMSGDIQRIKKDTKSKNPNVVIDSWSIG